MWIVWGKEALITKLDKKMIHTGYWKITCGGNHKWGSSSSLENLLNIFKKCLGHGRYCRWAVILIVSVHCPYHRFWDIYRARNKEMVPPRSIKVIHLFFDDSHGRTALYPHPPDREIRKLTFSFNFNHFFPLTVTHFYEQKKEQAHFHRTITSWDHGITTVKD